ncbi:ubiquinol-cytochrome C reductase [Rhizodiscina lignyota]|uniref:Complex III subunit 9 n=1 Tax=Rhizodiscina lignyota TaxID=1504668 RepID=A0A9P4IK53_9PEZI|nr:ubiquinol-cytochrome C reductase [Rhizodiscina lignyota]
MGVYSGLYNTFFRQNTTMLATVFLGAFGLQLAFDSGSTLIWNNINKGRQWQDIKAKYVQNAEEEE